MSDLTDDDLRRIAENNTEHRQLLVRNLSLGVLRLLDQLERLVAEVADMKVALADERNKFQFFRTSMTCFNDDDLLAYRVRQREHGARNASERVRGLEAENVTLTAQRIRAKSLLDESDSVGGYNTRDIGEAVLRETWDELRDLLRLALTEAPHE